MKRTFSDCSQCDKHIKTTHKVFNSRIYSILSSYTRYWINLINHNVFCTYSEILGSDKKFVSRVFILLLAN